MRVVFDTNVVIDAVANRQPFCKEAESILLMAAERNISGFLTSNSITDIYYVVRHNLPEPDTRVIIRSILYSLEIIEVGGADCWKALEFSMEDYEDALVAACAVKITADCIVSNDKKFLKTDSPVRVVSSAQLLALLERS